MNNVYPINPEAAAMASLYSRCEAHGVATLKMRDGEMFMFSKKTITDLLSKMEASNQEQAIIFVKSGPELQVD